MDFTMGNFLAIGLSVGFVLVYRILDKNNRSLEKVRKYVQTAQKELDAFLDARTQGLKDFTVDLQVHEATSKQIIQRVKTAEDELQAKAQNLEELAKRLEKLTLEVGNLESMSFKVDDNLTRLKEESEFVDKVGRRIKTASEQMQAIETELPAMVDHFAQKNEEVLGNLLNKYRHFTEAEKAKVDQNVHEAQTRFEQFQKFLHGLDAKKQAYIQEAQKTLQDTVSKAQALAAAGVKTLEKEWQGLEKGFLQTLKTHAISVDKLADESLGHAMKETREKIKKAEDKVSVEFGKLEARLSDFENDFRYRATKLEDVGKDFSQLESNLRAQMVRTGELIKEEFEVSTESHRQQALKALAEQKVQAEALHASMASLESELEVLKAKAYDNVSEKLQVFEDDFFVDLQKRDAAMTQSFEELQLKIVSRLTQSDQEVQRNLASSTKSWQDKLKESLSILQSGASEQVKKIETGLEDYQEKLNAQIQQSQVVLDTTTKNFTADLAHASEDFQKRVDNETGRREIALKEGLTKVERELDIKLKVVYDLVENGRSDLVNRIETTKSDIGVWQSRLAQMFKETQTEQTDQYQNFKTFIQEKISGLKEEFTRQRDDLIFSTQEERSTLKSELKELQDELGELTTAVQNKADTALEASRKDYDAFMMEFTRKVRALQAEQDVVIKDFRTALADNKDKSDVLQKKLFGKIEDQYNLLVVNLDEIDKRMKGFLSQTKLFERSDALKNDLTESIEDIKTQIEKVALQRKDLFEMENQMGRIRKIHEESGDRLNKFVAEKKKLEAMDGDFQKVVNLSQSMELRLQQVTNSHDTLQQIQFEIRKLEDYTKEMDAQLERLDRKRQILDSTTEGVDRNFNLIQQIERTIKTIQAESSPLPGQIEDMHKKIKNLVLSKGETEEAIQRSSKLGSILKDIEDRIQKMEKAREWLAGTETRLMEVGRQAEDHVKVLGTLTKVSDPKGKGKDGAPGADVRQVVLKLAHQGWAKGEIARVTKLSVGEIELILEMGTAG